MNNRKKTTVPLNPVSWRILILLFLPAACLMSCEKEDSPVQLPPPGELQVMSARLGVNYDTLVFVSLQTGKTYSRFSRIYDLAFEASAGGWRIYLNSSKLMMAASKNIFDIQAADTSALVWKPDDSSLTDDSLAIGRWCNPYGMNTKGVVFIDRGKPFYTGQQRFRKLVVDEVNDAEYKIRFSYLDNSGFSEMTIPKNNAYSLVYFTFDNGGQMVSFAPPLNDWDFVLTRYTHTYYEEPLSSPFRYYLVTGALLNKWNGSLNALVKRDSTAGYIPFESAFYPAILQIPLNNSASSIGFDWKYFDFNTNSYYIRADQWYLLRNFQELYFKIRFLDFYDESGNKGTVRFEFQRI